MPVLNGQKSAFIWRFFISFCFFFCIAPTNTYAAATTNTAACSTGNYQERVTVKRVIDGDTVILTDGRHIRLIGINTPEIRHDNRKPEIGAEQARDFLSRLLNTNKDLLLSYDDERTDHYGRTLAHLFLHDGTNIQSLMLKRGLATTFFIPPNLNYLECYQASMEYAQSHKIGLWALTQYQPLSANSITANDLGYHIISGKIKRIGESKSSIWINLTQNIALRIARDDLQYFDKNYFQTLTGKQVIASGWIYFSKGGFWMRIRHPVDIKITDASN